MTFNPEISNTFNQHASTYEKAALVQLEIGERLFERLDFLKITPRYILDLGCGTGVFSQKLTKKYPNAIIIGVDLAVAMLRESRKKQGLWRKWSLTNADMSALPFANATFDLVFSNQAIHWANPVSAVIKEVSRVMQPGACFIFSTIGFDTFKELKNAWAGVDNYAHINTFADMHDIGDCLFKERFLDTVVDMEWLTVHYSDVAKLLHSLKAQGVRNIHASRNKGLTTRRMWQSFTEAYEQFKTPAGKYPLTYEVIYGHAWKGEPISPNSRGETFIPVSAIRRK